MLMALLLPAVTILFGLARSRLSLPSDLLVYLLVIVLIAVAGGWYSALIAAVVSVTAADIFLTRPLYSLRVALFNDALALVVYVAVALLVSWTVEVSARRRRLATRSIAEAAVLTSMAESLLRGEGGLPQLLELVRETFGLKGLSVLQRRTEGTHDDTWIVSASCGTDFPELPEQATVQAELDPSSMLGARGPALSAADLEIFTACAAQIAEYLSQRKLSERAAGAEQQAQSERMRTAMAAAAGRALVDGVDSAKRAVVALRATPAAAREGEPIDTLERAVDRIGVLANQLEDVARARAGALDVRIRQVDVAEVVAAALDELGTGRHAVNVEVPEDIPDVISDAAVLTRVITALAANAIRLSSSDGTPKITASLRGDRVEIRFQITCLEQVPAKGRGDYFTVEAARDLLEAIDASLRTEGPDSAPTVIISVAAADLAQGLSTTTLTTVSPRKPNARPAVWSRTSAATVSGARRRAAAIRADCRAALATEMSGSRPDPEAVTASMGTAALPGDGSDDSNPSAGAGTTAVADAAATTSRAITARRSTPTAPSATIRCSPPRSTPSSSNSPRGTSVTASWAGNTCSSPRGSGEPRLCDDRRVFVDNSAVQGGWSGWRFMTRCASSK